MKSPIELPGLDHLISTCRTHGLRLDLRPPLDAVLRPHDSLLGQPFDPLLATVLSRCNGGILQEMQLFPVDTQDGLEFFNKDIRRRAEERLQEVLRYADFTGFAYYLVTVPSLADGQGIQPVMYLNMYDGVEMLPVASSVDMAFDAYACYLELLAESYGSVEAGREEMELFFPRTVPELIARDWRLVQMLESNRFEYFVARDRRSTDWIARVLAAVEGRK